MAIISPALRLGAGLLAWSATEYGMHRWTMHDVRLRSTRNGFATEHLDHHRNPFRTTAVGFNRDFLASRLPGLVVFTALPAPLVGGVGRAAPVGLGFFAGHVGYTRVHDSIHHRPPRKRVSRWLWRHHLQHHFSSPQRNFGVTTPLFDLLLGTRNPNSGLVRIPRRLLPRWLADENGIQPEFAAEYSV
ncbi:MAG: sterol desaturase family protein [Acidimicrobiales bacterium]|nr:sterol desaturase family protein [Acidimicrobiales bacterium]